MDTCAEEGLQGVYDAEADRLKQSITDLDQPLPTALVIGIVGVGTLFIGLILYKFTK